MAVRAFMEDELKLAERTLDQVADAVILPTPRE